MARVFLERRDDDALDGRDAIRRLVELLDDEGAGLQECTPPIDVVEHGDRIEITVDVPGVPADAVRVIYARGTLVIAGRKVPRACDHANIAFHLAERSFGRFVRAIRVVGLPGAVDGGRAVASLIAGELRVVLPRIEDRRGHDIYIEVTGG